VRLAESDITLILKALQYYHDNVNSGYVVKALIRKFANVHNNSTRGLIRESKKLLT